MNSFAKLPQENDTSWLTDEYDNKSPSAKNSSVSIGDDVIATTWKDGPYLLIVKIVSSKPASNWSLNGGIHFFFFFHLCIYSNLLPSASLQETPTLCDLRRES